VRRSRSGPPPRISPEDPNSADRGELRVKLAPGVTPNPDRHHEPPTAMTLLLRATKQAATYREFDVIADGPRAASSGS